MDYSTLEIVRGLLPCLTTAEQNLLQLEVTKIRQEVECVKKEFDTGIQEILRKKLLLQKN